MKVKELMELLQKEDPDATVKFISYETNESGTSWPVDNDMNYLTQYKGKLRGEVVNEVRLH